MTSKKAAKLNLVISLAFAIAIIIASKLLQDSEHAQTVTYILIAIWFIPFSYMSSIGIKN